MLVVAELSACAFPWRWEESMSGCLGGFFLSGVHQFVCVCVNNRQWGGHSSDRTCLFPLQRVYRFVSDSLVSL